MTPSTINTTSLPHGYRLQQGYPSDTDYLNLRALAGLSSKTPSQAAEVPKGSWYGCHIVFEQDNTVAGMGRIVGDGGWYFHIADMAVHPAHQKKGLGGYILRRLVQEILDKAPRDGKPYISLLADEAGRTLYLSNGFVETAPHSVGMVLPMK
jgi:GNAT superfamily N-acetyltransferase